MLKRFCAIVLRAGVPGLFIAVALSGEGVISIQVWIGAAAVWIAGTRLVDFILTAEVEPDRRKLAWRPLRRRRQQRSVVGHKGIRTINLLVATALMNSRAHTNALSPRLRSLAHHYLPMHHGVDLERDPHRAAEVLGDVAWLIDPSVRDRTPSAAEIEQFLDVILTGQIASELAREHENPVMAT